MYKIEIARRLEQEEKDLLDLVMPVEQKPKVKEFSLKFHSYQINYIYDYLVYYDLFERDKFIKRIVFDVPRWELHACEGNEFLKLIRDRAHSEALSYLQKYGEVDLKTDAVAITFIGKEVRV